MTTETPKRTFHIKNSEKCYRFKPEAFENHAPHTKGIYELVTFDENNNPKVLYIGAAFEKTIYDSITHHAEGRLSPSADELFAKYPNLYFDLIVEWDATSHDDAQDVYWWLIQKYQPEYNNVSEIKSSGRPGDIDVTELD